MTALLGVLDIVSTAAIGLLIGIILNSKNTIGLVNATANLFTSTFGAAASTIR
jgi:hypothetical protein